MDSVTNSEYEHKMDLFYSVDDISNQKLLKLNGYKPKYGIGEEKDYSWYDTPKGLYLIGSEVGLTKIGVTNNITKRMHHISGENAASVHLIAFMRCDNAMKVEATLHKLFKHKHSHREWFRLNQDDIDSIIMLHARPTSKIVQDVVWRNYQVKAA